MPWARITCVIKIKQIFCFHQTYRILNDRSIALAPSTAQLKPALWNDNLSTVDHWTICPLPRGFLSINTCTVSCLWLGIHRWRGPTVRHWPAAFYTGNLRIRQFWYPRGGGGGCSWNWPSEHPGTRELSGGQKLSTDYHLCSSQGPLYFYPLNLSGLDLSARLCFQVLFKNITDKVSAFKQMSCMFAFSVRFSSTALQCLNVRRREPLTSVPLVRGTPFLFPF